MGEAVSGRMGLPRSRVRWGPVGSGDRERPCCEWDGEGSREAEGCRPLRAEPAFGTCVSWSLVAGGPQWE